MYKVMALDVGTKRIGIALSDFLLMIANGHSYIDRNPEAAAIEKIKKIAAEAQENAANDTDLGETDKEDIQPDLPIEA